MTATPTDKERYRNNSVTMIPAARTAVDAPSDRSLRCPYYCEENVWRLAYRKSRRRQCRDGPGHGSSSSGDDITTSSCWYVVFISNPTGCVPMFQQLAESTCAGLNDHMKSRPVFWDYHVILIERRTTAASVAEGNDTNNNGIHSPSLSPPPSSYVWDIDSLLPCPCPIAEYLETSFRNYTNWPSKYAPFFRVIDAKMYLQHFSSDRSHMINPQTGEWSAPPPTYDCIVATGCQDSDEAKSQGHLDNNDTNNNNNNNGIMRGIINGDDKEKGTDTMGKNQNGKGHYTMKRYMAILQTDVDIDISLDFDKKIQGLPTEPFGKIYSMSQFQQMFGCS